MSLGNQTTTNSKAIKTMKKIFISALMAVVALSANAQKNITITPHIGFGIAYMSNITDDLRAGSGYLVGADAEYKVSDKFGVSAGVDYLYSDGDKAKYDVPGADWEYYTYSYLNIPVLAQYHLGNFALKAGLQPSFTLTADYHHEGSKSVKDEINTVNLSIPVGVAYNFKFPLTLELRYNYPLTRQNKNDIINGKDRHFQTVMVMAGWRF